MLHKPLVKSFLGGLAVFGTLAGLSQLVANSRYLDGSAHALRAWARALPSPPGAMRAASMNDALQRALLYDHEITRTHLMDGMLINRTVAGGVLDQCDSLLFSSLRYTSLRKLGFQERADDAWRAIEASQNDGHWRRHPRCMKSTSRDMLLGLLIALSQRPSGTDAHLRQLVARVRDHDGYFSDGPRYVSYLTPGVARLLALSAPAAALRAEELPDIVRDGYSTSELSVYGVGRGYEAHLIGLSVWLELELEDQFGRRLEPTLSERLVQPLIAPFIRGRGPSLTEQRLEWTTSRLVQLDRRNLFFRYLRLRAVGALTPDVAHRLLDELLAMSQFPASRLPMNCDRRADYLWQRASREYTPTGFACTRRYNGADFLWMAGLLFDATRADPPAYTRASL